MADGFTLDIDADLADLIERRAKEVGASPELIARQAITQALFRYEDYEWTGDDPRNVHGPYDEDEAATIPWEELKPRLRKKLDDLLAAKK